MASSPQDATRHAQLGLLTPSWEGRRTLVAQAGAVELKPTSSDVIEGAVVQAFQALIYARIGEPDQAIPQIERLLATLSAVDYADESITLSDLRTRWEWDPLRSDPRFQKIVADPEPKTVYK